jgi:hypothetical protein
MLSTPGRFQRLSLRRRALVKRELKGSELAAATAI